MINWCEIWIHPITTVLKLLQQVNYNDGNNIRDLHDHQENLIKQIHFFLDCFIRILDLSKYYWITLTLSYLFDLCVLLKKIQLNDEFILYLRSTRYRHSNNARYIHIYEKQFAYRNHLCCDSYWTQFLLEWTKSYQ